MRRRGLLFAAAAALSLLFAALVGGDEASEPTATSSSASKTSARSEGTSTRPPSTDVKRAPAPAENSSAPGAAEDRPHGARGQSPGTPVRPVRHEADADQRGEVDAYVREKRRTDADGLEEEHLPGGGVQVVLHDRFRNVPVATITEDGEVRIEH
ncbi:MAG: hypothetical protein RIT81_42285 [Deltaproteobacteria bacterium]